MSMAFEERKQRDAGLTLLTLNGGKRNRDFPLSLPGGFAGRLGRLEDRSGTGPPWRSSPSGGTALGAGQGVALWRTADRLRATVHDRVGLLGVRRCSVAADGLLLPLAVQGDRLTGEGRDQRGA